MPSYMEYPGIKGDSKEPEHFEWIVITAVTWPKGGNQRNSDLVVTKGLDNASALLQQESTRANPKTVKLAFTAEEAGGEQEYLRITLKGAIIASYHAHGETESLTLNSESVENEYRKAYGHSNLVGDFTE
jgi:type VI protein secretion system component Hcp